MQTPPPNFLIVMTDQQRADAMSLLPGGWTPHLAQFAQEAMQFSQTYCPSPHCCPSRATFFTGLYPSRHGVWNNVLNQRALSRGPLEGVQHWSESLDAAGYDLHYSGKWHVSATTTPQNHGWREHFVSAVSAQDHHGPKWEDYQKLAAFPCSQARPSAGIMHRPGYADLPLYATLPADVRMPHDEDAVEGTLEALQQVTTSPRPWAIYAGLFGPHDPYAVPPEWLDRIPASAVDLPTNYTDTMQDKPGIYRRQREQIWGQLSPPEAREARRHYLAYCAYADHQFGRILQTLEESGQAGNTVVIYVSDHGDYAGEHGLFCKGIAGFRGAYHVPNFVRWPAAPDSAGRQCDALVSLADFAPTLLELAGLPVDPARVTGRSLVPWLQGAAPSGWRDCLATQCDGVELSYSQRGIFTKDWKYLFNGFDQDELYDLRHDPDEITNLAARPEYKPIVRHMCQRLWRFAHAENDTLINDYHTVALAPFGPAIAFAPDVPLPPHVPSTRLSAQTPP